MGKGQERESQTRSFYHIKHLDPPSLHRCDHTHTREMVSSTDRERSYRSSLTLPCMDLSYRSLSKEFLGSFERDGRFAVILSKPHRFSGHHHRGGDTADLLAFAQFMD